MQGLFRPYKWLAFLALALMAPVIAGACGGGGEEKTPSPAATTAGGGAATAAPAAEALKIGALMSFTGDLSDFGEPIFTGIKMAADEINAAGGVLGKNIVVVRGDDGTAPQQGVSEAKRLVDVEKVQAIVGALASGVSLQVAESVTGPSKIVQISPASTSPAISDAKDNDFLFRTTISDAAQGIVLANLANDSGFKSVCTMYINSAYGKGLSNAFADAFKKLGGTVTAEVPHESQQATYSTELQKCKGADALAAIAYPESARVFLREAVEQSVVKNYLFVDGTKSADMMNDIGWDKFDQTRGTAPSSLPTTEASSFDERYKEAFGQLPPQPFIKEAYDAVYLIALAAEKAGSTDPVKIRDALRDVANAPGEAVGPGTDNFKKAVQLIKSGKDINYEGVTGPIEFDDKGDPAVGAVEWWHVDAATKDLVTDKKFKVDLSTKKVEELPLD